MTESAEQAVEMAKDKAVAMLESTEEDSKEESAEKEEEEKQVE